MRTRTYGNRPIEIIAILRWRPRTRKCKVEPMNLRHLENRALAYLTIAIVIALALWLFT